jgi:hypothetical protein
VYGKIFKKNTGTAKFIVPANTEHLWLVVSGAPTEHWPVVMGRQKTEASEEEQWPYEIKLAGTSVADRVITK